MTFAHVVFKLDIAGMLYAPMDCKKNKATSPNFNTLRNARGWPKKSSKSHYVNREFLARAKRLLV
jgi:hypothetical protein